MLGWKEEPFPLPIDSRPNSPAPAIDVVGDFAGALVRSSLATALISSSHFCILHKGVSARLVLPMAKVNGRLEESAAQMALQINKPGPAGR
jgi:hypothetical protein